ncbi:MAG: alpha/beta hydrolase family protein [Nocardioidaceae bacterium]|nr:alpha/beta hydrolase family protein [Nocardioidaceae bacterium]
MGLSYGEITRWKSADAEKLATAMSSRATALEDIEEDLRSSSDWGDSWSGSQGEEAASSSITKLGDVVTDLAAEATAIRRIASHVADGVSALHEIIIGVEEFAAKYSFAISDSGNLVDLAPHVSRSDDEEALREAARIDIEQSVSEIVSKGRFLERDAAADLSRYNDGEIDDGGATSVDEAVRSQMGVEEPPPAGTNPYHVNIWWESLSDDEKEQVIRQRGDEIRNLPGIASTTRDELNQDVLADDISSAEVAAEEARSAYEDFREEDQRVVNAYSVGQVSSDARALREKAEKAERKLEELKRLNDALDGDDAYLLEYDDSHPQLQAAVAVGDPDEADNVAITTPGYTTNVHDSVDGMVSDAEKLRETAKMIDPRGATSTIAFMGYQAPQDVKQLDFRVGSTQAAEDGAVQLSEAVRGVQATNGDPDLNLSLLGHSYGSTTAGIAAQQLADGTVTPVDSLTLYGSPGVPEMAPHLDETEREMLRMNAGNDFYNPNQRAELETMGLDESRAFYMENDGDAVSGTFGAIGQNTTLGLGIKPESWGMTELSTETAEVTYPNGMTEQRYDWEGHNAQMQKTDPGYDVSPHSAFPKELTTSQFNLAAVVAGYPEYAIR